MQAKSIVECSIKLPFDIKIFALSIFEWPLRTGVTVHDSMCENWGFSVNIWVIIKKWRNPERLNHKK